MNKHILTLTFLALVCAQALEARHHKTQTAPAAPTQAVEATPSPAIEDAQSAAAVQTLQEIVKSPEDVRYLVTQLEQQQEVKGWLARNKKFLINAGISAAVMATLILWWLFKRQNQKSAPVVPNVADPLLNNALHVAPVHTSASTSTEVAAEDPIKGLLRNYVEDKKLFPDDNEKRPHTFSSLKR